MAKESTTFPIFSMINDFESKSFHIPEIKANHRSLYYFLLGVVMHNRGMNRFEMAYDYGMRGSKIGNHTTYTDALKVLELHKFLTYTPGKNRFSFPIIELHFCKPTANLLQTYCESIGVSTVNNIKAKDTKDTKDTKEDKDTPDANAPQVEDVFIKFWDAYGKKVDKKKCRTAWNNLTKKNQELVLGNVRDYVKAHPNPEYRKNPLTYLHGECWNDDLKLETTTLNLFQYNEGTINQGKMAGMTAL